MDSKRVSAAVELRFRGKSVKLSALVDVNLSKSVVSKRVADELNSFVPLEETYEIEWSDKEERLRIVGRCIGEVIFQGVEVPGKVTFEVAENLCREADLIIGRPEADLWNIIFTSDGPKPRRIIILNSLAILMRSLCSVFSRCP